MGSAIKTCCIRHRTSLRGLENYIPDPSDSKAKTSDTIIIEPSNFSHDKEMGFLNYDTFFKMGNLIGLGPHGEVYECLNLQDGEMMATKIVHCKEEERRRIFYYLEEKLFSIKHEFILEYIDIFESEQNKNDILIVSRLISGYSLKNILENFNCLDEKICALFVKQILEGLIYLNHQGLCHSNLKSTNVLVESSGTIKLNDFFTVSRKLLLVTKGVKKPFNYLAPEILLYEAKSLKSDIWSLGCLIIELISNKPAWGSDSTNIKYIMDALRKKQRPRYPENISDGLKEFLDKCLEINEKKRLSAEELLADKFLSEEKIEYCVGDNKNVYDEIKESIKKKRTELFESTLLRKATSIKESIRKKNAEERKKFELQLLLMMNNEGTLQE